MTHPDGKITPRNLSMEHSSLRETIEGHQRKTEIFGNSHRETSPYFHESKGKSPYDYFQVFQSSFDILRLSLVDPSKIGSNQQVKLVDNFEQLFEKFADEETSRLKSSHEADLKQLRILISNSFEQLFRQIRSKRNRVEALLEISLEKCSSSLKHSLRRMASSQLVAESRLKELIFELIGEYAKCQERLKRRSTYVVEQGKLAQVEAVWRLLWRRFSLRLCFDINSSLGSMTSSKKPFKDKLQSTVLSPRDNSDVFQNLESTLRESSSTRKWDIISVIRFSKSEHGRETQSPPHREITFASKVADFDRIRDVLKNWLLQRTGLSSSQATSNRPSVPRDSPPPLDTSSASTWSFLSSRAIEWMHPPSFHWAMFKSRGVSKSPSTASDLESDFALDQFVSTLSDTFSCGLASDRVYFCLEEREMLPSDPPPASPVSSTYSAIKAIQAFYCREVSVPSHIIETALDSELVAVKSHVGNHRESRHSFDSASIFNLVSQYPDILEARTAHLHLHFGCATIVNLLESSVFRAINWSPEDIDSLPSHLHLSKPGPQSSKTVFPKLFCLVRCSSSINNTLCLVPLSRSCALELVRKHLSPYLSEERLSVLIPSPDYLTLLPDSVYRRDRERDISDGTFECKYALVSSECNPVRDKRSLPLPAGPDPPGSLHSDGTAPCYYLVQLFKANRRVPKELIGNGEMSPREEKAHTHGFDDDQTLFDILRSRTKQVISEGTNSDGAVLLSSLCRWRSCLAESCTNQTSNAYLCDFHCRLKRFLDDATPQGRGNTSESNKYLPKSKIGSSSSDSKFNFAAIKASSQLLQEMWDGKLKLTVQTFLKKVLRDFSLKHRLAGIKLLSSEPVARLLNFREARSSSGTDVVMSSQLLPEAPEWAMWKSKEAVHSRRLSDLMRLSSALEEILLVERAASDEIEHLSSLRVFPTVELASIRKDIKSLKDIQEGGGKGDSEFLAENLSHIELEQKFCNRKFTALKTRRLEEEELRAVQMKKLAKLKAMDEAQAKDPANFKNQIRR